MSYKQRTIEEMKAESNENFDSIYYLEDGRIIHGGIVYKDREQFLKVTTWATKMTKRLLKVLDFFSFKTRKKDEK